MDDEKVKGRQDYRINRMEKEQRWTNNEVEGSGAKTGGIFFSLLSSYFFPKERP